MTDVQNCLTSEHVNAIVITTTTPNTSPPTTPTTPTTPAKNVDTQARLEPMPMPTSPFVLRAPTSANSKLILQNMEEVLNSVKKKHREKHKRKREKKRRAALLAGAEEEEEKKPDDSHVQMDRPQPLREKAASNGHAAAISKSKPARKSSPRPLKCSTPARERQKEAAAVATPKAAKVATNVFDLMMNARNRSLGTNASGLPSPSASEKPEAATQASRKQLLQEWNERKGGAKRKLVDEARGEYIEEELAQRAKRLRNMLTKPATDAASPEAAKASPIVKRGRGRPRTRRLSSLDAVEQPPLLESQLSQDSEAAEFLAKLASPTKKRDSLLGYFAKVESPKELADKQKEAAPAEAIETASVETPKRRMRRSNTKAETPAAAVVAEEAATAVEPTQTPSGRPRRSCAGKARYDYDKEASPAKAMPAATVTADESVEVIDLESSSATDTPKKLAPLFVRQMPKPSQDPTALRARHEFLRSGVPDKLKQEQARQKQFEQYYEDTYELFPRIAHVQQLGQAEEVRTEQLNLCWQLKDEEPTADNEDKAKAGTSKSKLAGITNCGVADFQAGCLSRRSAPAFKALPSLENKRAIVKLWKNEFERFPTFKCYNQMREKYRHFSAIDSAQDTQQVGESFVVTRRTRRSLEAQQQFDPNSTEEAKPPATAPNGELLFTEKYKPLLFEQVLVNLTPVQQLREFLANWNGNSGNRNSQTLDDASFDFGNDSNSVGAASNTMVLLGPCSSGKTNAVFTLANDMNFNVLEINAGMKRTGKKLMQELQEATQSHQIRKDSKQGSTAAAPSQQLLKLSLNSLKAKRQQSETSEMSDLSQSVRKSLILIEDADILFDNTDAGFTDAIYTLAASSKRPVIVVASDPNCAHLQRLMQQNTVNFHAPNVLNISKFLAVLALMENCPIELDELISLYLYNDKNLRKTLLELQFYIQSGGDRTATNTDLKSPPKSPPKSAPLSTVDGLYMHKRLFEFYTCAQNVKHRIPFPIDFRLLRLNLYEIMRASPRLLPQPATAAKNGGNATKRKSRSPKKAWLNSATQKDASVVSPLGTLAAFYENISLAALFDEPLDCTDRLQTHLSEDIAHALVEQAVTVGLAPKEFAYNLFDKPPESHNICDQLGNCLIRTASSRALDYEPALRAICRSEKERSGLERRSSRFYHYLRNHTVNMCGFKTEPFDAACSILQEATELATKTEAETELAATESRT